MDERKLLSTMRVRMIGVGGFIAAMCTWCVNFGVLFVVSGLHFGGASHQSLLWVGNPVSLNPRLILCLILPRQRECWRD